MNRSLYAGLSSTMAQQTKMDVAANNLANVSTIGYKAAYITFKDQFYQTLRGGRPNMDDQGGVSPIQVGSGVSVGAITVLYSQGALQTTGQPLDAAVQGQGMLVVESPEGTYYTRDGALALDDTSTLVTAATGMRVMGWSAIDGEIDTSGPMGALSFPLQTMRSPQATSSIDMAGNLASSLDVGDTMNALVSVYDSLGNTHDLSFVFEKTADGEWEVTATCEGVDAVGTLTYDADGKLTAGGTLTLGPVAIPTGAADMTVEIDLSETTQYVTGNDIAATSQDGYGPATLQGVSIADGGLIMGSYSDGRSQQLATLAMATFSNFGGLERIGNNQYKQTAASGIARVGEAGTSGRGQIIGGALEMSNTDLTGAFLEMLVTQRAYQASTRVISTANNLLEEAIRIMDR